MCAEIAFDFTLHFLFGKKYIYMFPFFPRFNSQLSEIHCSGLPDDLLLWSFMFSCKRLLHYTLDLNPATLCQLHSFLYSPLQVRTMVVMC